MKLINVLHPLLRLPYILVFAKLKLVSQLIWGIELWPRHSYLTSAFIPTKSDLDLTAYVSNLDSLNSYLKYYSFMRKLVPFLGELSVYTEESVNYIKTHQTNGFELERDPILLSRFKIELNQKYFTREKAVSYLLMALINDLHKIVKNSDARIKKWKYHFAHVNTAFAEKGITAPRLEINESTLVFSVLTAVVNLSDVSSAEEAQGLRAKLKLFMEMTPKAEITLNFIDLVKPLMVQENTELFTYFIEYTSGIEGFVPKLTEPQFEISASQIDWVILRLLKQNFNSEIAAQSVKKLNSFKLFIDALSQKNPNLKTEESLSKINSALLIFN